MVEQEAVALTDPRVQALEESLDRLRAEVEELGASRQRLVRATDADRRRIERELHDGAQQRLVGLAVNLQHARKLVDADPAGAAMLLDEMRRDLQKALEALRSLAQRIHPPLLGAGGLRTALRSAAAAVGVPTDLHVSGTAINPEAATTVYRCWVEALEHAGEGVTAAITVHDEDGMLVFEIVQHGAGSTSADELASIRDRVEALGGRLSIEPEPPQGVRISGSLPVSP
ncbi:MAG TPA: histidine kinase [Gaiellaceae bacterium]|nr:histidine kinase [Gaiellaceae bacterium]